MLKQFLFICFISIILSCSYLDTRPKYVSATQNISVELSDDKTIDYNNLKTFNLNLNEFQISGRQIPTSNGLHKVDEYQKIKINGDTLTFEVTLKLYVVISSSSSYYSGYSMTIGALDFSKMEIVEATMEPNEPVEVSFSENSKSFSLSGVFRNGYIISLRYVYITTNTDLFYKSQYVTVGSKGEYYGICKVTFEAEGDSIILGTKNNLLTFDGSKVDYSQDCPEEQFTDYIIITRYGAKWNSYISQKAYSSYDNTGYAELTFPRMSLGGNNFILENNVDTPYVNYIDENVVKHNGTHYIISYNYPKKGNLNTNMSLTFINSIDNEFVFPMDESFVLNTSTENTRAKAKEILESDTSNEPDHIKLGRWVTNNMKYSISYSGVDMTVDEILSKLIGVCEHFTKLYNALLSSIGIKAVYLSGYAITGKNGTPEKASSVAHAWTMAKIDGKWKAFDSTWGLFFDKFPISHVFRGYYDFSSSWKYSKVSVSSPVFDTTFSEFVDGSRLTQLKEEVEEALFIREEKVKKKEVDLNQKEYELNNTEKELNLRESNINEKEGELYEKEKELNNTELKQKEKENELNNKETELNSTELYLKEKEEELLEKEERLNNTEIYLENKKIELNNKEIELNETELFLNDKNAELLDKETKLNFTELTLNTKEEELIQKETKLNMTEATLNSKEDQLNEKEIDLNIRESNLIPQEEELKEKEQKLNNTEIQLQKKEEELLDKETKLNSTELTLKTKEEQLKVKENYLNKTEIELNNKEESLSEKEEELNKKEQNLTNKEESLNKKEIELNNKKSVLDTKEKDLNDREINIESKENKLNLKEQDLNKKEQNLTNQEESLNEKEEELNQKEITLKSKEEELNNKENSLNDKETVLNEKGESNLTGLIVVCVLLGISLLINIYCIIQKKKSKNKSILSMSTDEKIRELM